MAKRTVIDPQGERWRVRTKWFPRKLRWRGKDRDLPVELMDGAELLSLGDELPVIGVIAAVIAGLVVAIGLVLFIVPALVFVLELLLVLALGGLGIAGRVLLGRPWTVEARQAGSDEALEFEGPWLAGEQREGRRDRRSARSESDTSGRRGDPTDAVARRRQARRTTGSPMAPPPTPGTRCGLCSASLLFGLISPGAAP